MLRKIVTPIAADVAASRSLTRPVRRRAELLVFHKIRRRNMSIEQQIEELRAELSWCDEASERRQIEAELRAAEKQWKRCSRAQRRTERAGEP